MKILGIKLTHDGGLALIDNGQLIFSYEMEKIKNNNRIEKFILTFKDVQIILNEYGYSIKELDHIAIDGWGVNDQSIEHEPEITTLFDAKLNENQYEDIRVAKYGRLISEKEDVLTSNEFVIESLNLKYTSYMHVTGHIFGAYTTSPFSREEASSYILVWDGGMPPQLFYFDFNSKKVINNGYLFLFTGDIYTGFAKEYKPFNEIEKHHYSVPGKLMAYIALGETKQDLLNQFQNIYDELEQNAGKEPNIRSINKINKDFIDKVKNYLDNETRGFRHQDILSTFHMFIEKLLINKLKVITSRDNISTKRLCISGGCGLSIKWNSKIRESGIFSRVWVPPFPNDSGSSIGVAASLMVQRNSIYSLKWDVYSGPSLVENEQRNKSYLSKKCDIESLALMLSQIGEPIVFLNGRAELGPRALGNRSIIAPAINPKMKDLLNRIKGREKYRPVSPICLETEAKYIFSPGTHDPYMLFDHFVKKEWENKVPAIVHLDKSARLQTLNKNQNKIFYQLLSYYYKISGIPLLCNTSANFNGKGFFPDVHSAMQWDKLNFIWSNGMLYERIEKLELFKKEI